MELETPSYHGDVDGYPFNDDSIFSCTFEAFAFPPRTEKRLPRCHAGATPGDDATKQGGDVVVISSSSKDMNCDGMKRLNLGDGSEAVGTTRSSDVDVEFMRWPTTEFKVERSRRQDPDESRRKRTSAESEVGALESPKKRFRKRSSNSNGNGINSTGGKSDDSDKTSDYFLVKEGSGSRMPPWHVEEIEDMAADLDGSLSALGNDLTAASYNMSEALLSLPSLTVFKQEASSPSQDTVLPHSSLQGQQPQPQPPPPPTPTPSQSQQQQQQQQQQPQPPTPQQQQQQQVVDDSHDQSTTLQGLLQQQSHHQKRGGSSSVKSGEIVDKSENCRFQYVLAAATSIATKLNEETLTYLNQGQSYEIKLKKVGELSNFRGKILKSVIRICFHERRLQYMEKEQILAWQASRPGERIVELDVPLSYGLFDVEQDPHMLNMLSFLWDPTKEVGAYIKVNCISTEFTPKKHGGEKGVPFRIQVETFIEGEATRLHAAACQIKVFKLKGADRKHKQDREKILKRPPSEQDKYQPSYECTVLNDLLPEAVFPAPSFQPPPPLSSSPRPMPKSSIIYSPEDGNDGFFSCHSPLPSPISAPAVSSSSKVVDQVGAPGVGALPDRHIVHDRSRTSPGSPHPLDSSEIELTPDSSCQQTMQWLREKGFTNHVSELANYNGADLLKLARSRVRLCIYVCVPGSEAFFPVFLKHIGRSELSRKLTALIGVDPNQMHDMYVQGPNGIRILVTDELVRNIKNESIFSIELLQDETCDRFILLLKPESIWNVTQTHASSNAVM